MIGQHNLQSQIEQLVKDGTFPRFSILVGPRGSGKKTLAREIAKKIPNALVFDIGLSVEDVRVSIENAYKMINTVVRIIPDADTMSNAAKNALLKVTEEPPNNAYWIMTLEDENNTLETIRSRGTVFHMDRYTPDEIAEYYGDNYFNEDDACWGSRESIIKELCETPGDVHILSKDVLLFYDYVQLVVDNIAEVSLANAFKIPSKVALKEDVEAYDLRLFWKAFMNVCRDRSYDQNTKEYCECIVVTSKYLQRLKVKGINKQMLIDNWVLEIRNLWQ